MDDDIQRSQLVEITYSPSNMEIHQPKIGEDGMVLQVIQTPSNMPTLYMVQSGDEILFLSRDDFEPIEPETA